MAATLKNGCYNRQHSKFSLANKIFVFSTSKSLKKGVCQLLLKNVLHSHIFKSWTSQCCHSKKIKNPSWANKKPKKTQGHISIHLAQISGKNPAFSLKKPTFAKKIGILSAKISDDLFFSHQL